jgi:hypothetical protein
LQVFDGNRTISYTNGNKQYELASGSIQQPLYTLLKNNDGNFWIQEENISLLLFEPGTRKCTTVFTHKAGKEELMMYEGIADNDVYTTTFNHLKSILSIWKKVNADSLVKIYEEPMSLQNQYSYKLAGKNHWVMSVGEIIRISLDGKEIKHYKSSGSVLYYVPFVVNETIYFMDNRQDAIYTWNSLTDTIEPILYLPEMVKNRVNNFYIKDNIFYLGVNLAIFILDTSNYTIQDLTPGFIALAKKEAPNSFGINFLKFFLRSDSSLLACTQKDIYRLKKKVPAAEQFRQTINTINKISSITSFRGLTEDDKKTFTQATILALEKKRRWKKNLLTYRLYKMLPVWQDLPTALITEKGICFGTMLVLTSRQEHINTWQEKNLPAIPRIIFTTIPCGFLNGTAMV